MKRISLIPLFNLFWFFAISQINPLPFPKTDYEVAAKTHVTEFDLSRCNKKSSTTFQLSNFPFTYRSSSISQNTGNFRTPHWQQFTVFFAENYHTPMYEIHLGTCRGVSFSFPVKFKGIYWVRFWDETKPTLIEVNTQDLPNIKVEEHIACSLHSTDVREKVLIDKHITHFGNDSLTLTLYYKFREDEIWRKVQTARVAGIFAISNIQFGQHYLHFTDDKSCFFHEFTLSPCGDTEKFGPLPDCIQHQKKPKKKSSDAVLLGLNKSD